MKEHQRFELFDIALIIVILIIIIINVVKPSLQDIKIIAEIIQSLGIGVGALIAGYGGKNIISEYLIKSKFNKFKNRYPIEELNNNFRLIQCTKSGDPDAVYIHDYKDNTKHWIVNQRTRIDLGFNPSQYIDISKSEFDRIKPGESIDATS